MEYHYQNNLYKSGIYKITNKLNGRIYIGSSKLFKLRWKQHSKALRNNKHSNKFLQRDFNKCGEGVFVFEIVEGTDGKTKEERLLIEEVYINQYFDSGKECYNFNTWAVAKEGPWSNDPEETKRKISASAKKMWSDPEKAAAIRKSMKESLNDPEVSLSKQEGLLKSWQGNQKRRNAASERMTERMGNNTPETKKIIENFKLSQIKGRDTFRKIIKEDAEFRQTYIDIGTKKTENLNERYKNDAEYKAMMDQKSIENIKAYNEKKIQNMPVKAPLISPDGKVYSDIRSLTVFAKEHGLDSSSLYKLYSGKLNEVKGWKFFVR
jgi:group I intron endonuclease